MANVMSGSLEQILKEGLEKASKNDAKLKTAMGKKKMDDCIAAIYQGLYELASKNRGGARCMATSGDDQLLIGTAIHWFTEDNPTKDSIVEMLKGGTSLHQVSTPKTDKPTTQPKAEGTRTDIKADAKPSTQSKPKATIPSKPKATIPSAPKPEPKVVVPAYSIVDDDEDFDID